MESAQCSFKSVQVPVVDRRALFLFVLTNCFVSCWWQGCCIYHSSESWQHTPLAEPLTKSKQNPKSSKKLQIKPRIRQDTLKSISLHTVQHFAFPCSSHRQHHIFGWLSAPQRSSHPSWLTRQPCPMGQEIQPQLDGGDHRSSQTRESTGVPKEVSPSQSLSTGLDASYDIIVHYLSDS